ncbi:unnamed protein product, partial [Closterium sp. NIES-54]
HQRSSVQEGRVRDHASRGGQEPLLPAACAALSRHLPGCQPAAVSYSRPGHVPLRLWGVSSHAHIYDLQRGGKGDLFTTSKEEERAIYKTLVDFSPRACPLQSPLGHVSVRLRCAGSHAHIYHLQRGGKGDL